MGEQPTLSILLERGGWISAQGEYIRHPQQLPHLHPDALGLHTDWRMGKAKASLKRQGFFRSTNYATGEVFFAFSPQSMSKFLEFSPERGFFLRPYERASRRPTGDSYDYASLTSLQDFLQALTLYVQGDGQAVTQGMHALMNGRRPSAFSAR